MRMYDVINKKKYGNKLNKEEINFVIKEFTCGNIPDYQMSAFLMAVYFKGMDDEETANLTIAMANSGDLIDLSSINGTKVDKHSTGGVGDKTSLIISPVVALFGVPVAKMSGRGLGHTGGTIDKLEAIPGFKTSLNREEFINNVNKCGLCIAGQSGNLAPADKKIYALRDVTATIDSIPLIAASIMSKKIAAGSDCILLDVKMGSGAFMKNIDDSIKLAQAMVGIGENCNRRTMALITDMSRPLGSAIGNSLEIIEVIETLKGNGPKDLADVCTELAANMLYLAQIGDIKECHKMAEDTINSGKALNKFAEMVKMQGGDDSYIFNVDKFEKAKIIEEVLSEKEGYILHMDGEGCGMTSVILGAGRETVESVIDYSAGIVSLKKTGDYVKKGDILAVIHTSSKEKLVEGKNKYKDSLVFSNEKPKTQQSIYARVDINGTYMF